MELSVLVQEDFYEASFMKIKCLNVFFARSSIHSCAHQANEDVDDSFAPKVEFIVELELLLRGSAACIIAFVVIASVHLQK